MKEIETGETTERMVWSGVDMGTKTNRMCNKKEQKDYNLKWCLYTLKYTPKSIRVPENQ